MAVSHQSGVIHQHWNDPPPATFATKTPTPSSTPALPTPPMTPSIERTSTPELIRGLQELLGIPSMLVGRNKEMVFTRVRGLIRDIQEGKMPGTPLTPPTLLVPSFSFSFLSLPPFLFFSFLFFIGG